MKPKRKYRSPWLLCPSKRLPGKFFYFNGSTGETVWSRGDKNKNMKRRPVTDKAHIYPEPFDPPIDDSANTTNSSSLKNTGNTFTHNANVRPSPVFGQTVFPKYVLPDFTPKCGHYVPSQMPQHRQMLDQITQTYEPEPSMFVPSFPQEFQFQPFKEKTIFDKANTTNSSSLKNTGNTFTHNANVRPSPVFGQTVFSKYVPPDFTPKCGHYVPSQMPQHRQMLDQITQTYEPEPSMFVPSFPQEFQFQPFKEKTIFDKALNFEPMFPKLKMKDEACHPFVPRLERHRTQLESDTKPKLALKRSRSVENHLLTKDVKTSTLGPQSKVENKNYKFSEPDKNDLGFKLLAKKKKVETVVGEKAEKSTDQSKATKRRDLPPEGILLKKRVTFDLQEPAASQTNSEDVQVTDQSPDSHIERPLWYVAADTETLLSGMHSIKEFVKSDASCRLLVRHAVYSELISLGRGDSGAVAVSARQVFSELIAHDNIVVQSKPEYKLSPEDSILQSCWSLLQEDCHVILITSKKNIRNKAKAIKLQCYTLDDIKMDDHIDNEIDSVPHNDSVKLKIIADEMNYSRENDTEKSDNLVMQSLKEINDISLTKPIGMNIRPSRIKKKGKITKLKKKYDEELGRFCIKNSVMENRVKSRLDEWVCRLSQIMEGALTDLLLKEKTKTKRIMPPKHPLFEVIQGTRKIFKKHRYIKLIIDQFPIELISCSFNNRKLKKDLKPDEFMKLVGFSVILIDQVKEILNCKELYEAKEMLECLIKNIEDPETDIEMSMEEVNTPIFSTSEIENPETPIGFKKSRPEVLEYLKTHFAAWQSETDMTDTVGAIDNEPNILITSGKNLNTLKIYSNKTITEENNTDSAPNYTQTNNENNEKLNSNNQPKVTRNVKIIDAFQERLKKHAHLELDELDYEACTQAKPFARKFLIKVKSTLLQLYHFINTSIKQYQEGMSLDKKADMKRKTELARNSLLRIAERLKNIIARESAGGVTLKHLVIKAGDYVEDDVLVDTYKQKVTELLEQVHKLEEALQYLLNI